MLGISTVEEPIIKVEKPPQSTPAIVYTVEQPRQPIARERPAKPIVEPTKQYAQRRVNEVFGQGQWNAFDEIVRRESGWNYKAINPTSKAWGLPQCLPVSKCVSQYPDFKDNPKSQIEWMIQYISDRYKTPKNALYWHNKHNWY